MGSQFSSTAHHRGVGWGKCTTVTTYLGGARTGVGAAEGLVVADGGMARDPGGDAGVHIRVGGGRPTGTAAKVGGQGGPGHQVWILPHHRRSTPDGSLSH